MDARKRPSKLRHCDNTVGERERAGKGRRNAPMSVCGRALAPKRAMPPLSHGGGVRAKRHTTYRRDKNLEEKEGGRNTLPQPRGGQCAMLRGGGQLRPVHFDAAALSNAKATKRWTSEIANDLVSLSPLLGAMSLTMPAKHIGAPQEAHASST